MTSPATLERISADDILEVIRSNFDLDSSTTIEVKSIEVDNDEQKILIELLITTSERPAALAQSYFGLTEKVRDALGSDWSGFFPVIAPQFNSGVHA